MRRLKAFLKAHWPALRLRAILLGVLLFTAAMPLFGAVFLRVYENVLVRQTEAELIAQAAAIEATLRQAWPGVARPSTAPPPRDDEYEPEPLAVDLNAMDTLPERPAPVSASAPRDPDAIRAAEAAAPMIWDTARATLASIRVLDRAGTVVLGRAEVGLNHSNLDEVRSALGGAPQTVLRRRGDYAPRYPLEILSRAADIRVHYARPVRVEGKVVGALLLSRSPRSLFRGVYDDLGKIALGVGAIFLVILAVATLLSRTITRPIEQLSEATKRVALGPSAAPAPPATATIEIRQLFENFSRMAGEIDRRSSYLRDFAAAMSHEFKTPLAGIRGALELLEEHGASMSEDERRRFLANANADAARLSRLVGRLLELARADMAAPRIAGRTELAPPFRNVADALGGPRLSVRIDAAAGLVAAAPPEVIEAVLTTLVENASQAGARNVDIRAHGGGRGATIEVADDGPGIDPADRQRLFEPFFTTRRAVGGTGLGLAIARSLLQAQQGTIELVDTKDGATFRIRLSAG